MNLNKVIIIGRLTADPQIRTTPSGQPVCSFSLATNRVWRSKEGERREETEFHNIVAWGRQAEIAHQYLTKGSTAMIEGRLRTRSWQDTDGKNRRTTEIICERLQLGPRLTGAAAPAGSRSFSASSNTPSNNNSPEDYPFPDEDNNPSPGRNQNQDNVPVINLDEDQEKIKDEDIPF